MVTAVFATLVFQVQVAHVQADIIARCRILDPVLVAGKPFTAEFSIYNQGEKAVLLEQSFLALSDYYFQVKDSKGKIVEYKGHRIVADGLPYESLDGFFELDIGRSYGMTREIQIDQPGTYTMSAEIHRQDHSKIHPGIWHGILKTPSIKFSVLPAPTNVANGVVARRLGESPLQCTTPNGSRWTVNADCTEVRITQDIGEFKFPLPQFRLEAGGYWLASILPLGNKFLMVTNQWGAFVINRSGDIVEGWQGGEWNAVEVRGVRETPYKPEALPWREGATTALLARSESNGRVLMTFWRGPFDSPTIAILTTKLKPEKLITFVDETPIVILKNAKDGWDVTLRRRSKDRVVHVSSGGRTIVDNSPSPPLGDATRGRVAR